jgi:hypothetical protein
MLFLIRPVCLSLSDRAFNLKPGEACRKVWERIPLETDILITHGPPRGHGDKNVTGECCGCADLLQRVQHVKPRLHLFGHIHEGSGCLVVVLVPVCLFSLLSCLVMAWLGLARCSLILSYLILT